MDFISNREQQIREMLSFLGLERVEELFSELPASLLHSPPLFDDGLSEFEGLKKMEELGKKNRFPDLENYLGTGSYEHHIPAIVSSILAKSEFLTSYTPYQAEASQGLLQALFEFQSALCALTGMEVANASLYDGASACGEALLMCLRQKRGRRKLLLADSLHPHYRAVAQQYIRAHDVEVLTVPFTSEGVLDREQLSNSLDETCAALLIQSPNFLGIVEELEEVIEEAHRAGALVILSANPLSYALFRSAGELGADLAIGELQPLGLPMQFGGPYAGYLACKEELVRQMPGRLVGETVDREGRRGFVLTLQTREQHIRREKATSNICTSQALSALASLITLLWYGKEGLYKLALTNYRRAAYLKSLCGQEPLSRATCFNEFAIRFEQPMEEVLNRFRQEGIEPGLHLGSYYPFLEGALLVAVTETKDLAALERYAAVAESIRRGRGG